MASEDFADKKFFELEDMRNILTGSVPPVLLSILARHDSHQWGRLEMHITSIDSSTPAFEFSFVAFLTFPM